MIKFRIKKKKKERSEVSEVSKQTKLNIKQVQIQRRGTNERI